MKIKLIIKVVVNEDASSSYHKILSPFFFLTNWWIKSNLLGNVKDNKTNEENIKIVMVKETKSEASSVPFGEGIKYSGCKFKIPIILPANKNDIINKITIASFFVKTGPSSLIIFLLEQR